MLPAKQSSLRQPNYVLDPGSCDPELGVNLGHFFAEEVETRRTCVTVNPDNVSGRQGYTDGRRECIFGSDFQVEVQILFWVVGNTGNRDTDPDQCGTRTLITSREGTDQCGRVDANRVTIREDAGAGILLCKDLQGFHVSPPSEALA